MKINFINKSGIQISDKLKKDICKKVNLVIKILKNPLLIEINIIFVRVSEIQKLNKKYFSLDKPTDVISFKSKIPVKKSKVLGDIIICPKIAFRNAKKYNNKSDHEIQNLAIHGLLHLFGYNHLTIKDRVTWKKVLKRIKLV